jgi:hypothetical protein
MVSFQVIVQVTKLVSRNDIHEAVSKRYFVRYGSRCISSGGREILKGKQWKEIAKEEADESLRPPGSGIEIGDGETWIELDGTEKLWCETHRAFFELRVWIKDS